MKFAPYQSVGAVPNVIVDGRATEGTVLTLSHWPKSGTPQTLLADTSTETVFKYLDTPAYHVQADAVSNNHFDEDGLAGMLALTQPALAVAHRERLIDVARTGDFGVYATREAARIALTIAAFADPGRSPVPAAEFALPYPEFVGRMYERMFAELPALLTSVDAYRALWEEDDAAITRGEEAIASGRITIEEDPRLDFAVVRVPAEQPDCHAYALHGRTTCTRLFVIHGRRLELRYRYEGWVQMATRRPALRVDLSELAAELSDADTAGTWTFDGVDKLTPKLRIATGAESALEANDVLTRVRHHLTTGAPAWNPYS